jgi:hypothetical protein
MGCEALCSVLGRLKTKEIEGGPPANSYRIPIRGPSGLKT